MSITQLTPVIRNSLTTLCAELVDGAPTGGGAFVLNSGDAGLLRSLDKCPTHVGAVAQSAAAELIKATPGGQTLVLAPRPRRLAIFERRPSAERVLP